MQLWRWLCLKHRFPVCFAAVSFFLLLVSSSKSPLGIHPLDAKYFAAEVIKCKDGSKSFTRDRLNDNFCDCLDGTDEPDCCDGSDEYDGSILCPNTCIMGGNVEYKTEEYVSTTTHLHSTKLKEMKIGIKLEDLIQTLAGLKMITVAEVALGCFLVVKWVFHKRVKSKKRHHR
ncbi:hypothetical protein E1A91_D12G077500v1 [Gossypium mustelinum]|uniref:Glucosidase 2 subunit beta isoform X4 n=3 Tax=Gossypium TaxID=3633 RepID=A0A1U8N7S1_GOSHI|nr:glucosidase 2 subunit beta isoform X4 [Gossypium hirsutum]TYH38374.1 hypothetical protein ES332_D12G106000v1 [Gossypium tomentosum]TYI50079.1 hypothetical protein E1A91_D12G077500v1 [Gossypium mustelinum]